MRVIPPTERDAICSLAAYLVDHFIKREKWPEIEIDMNSWTRVNDLAAFQGSQGTRLHGV